MRTVIRIILEERERDVGSVRNSLSSSSVPSKHYASYS